MNKETHVAIGALVWEKLPAQKEELYSRPAFLFGCIAPDLFPRLILQPHTAAHRLKKVQRKIEKLFQKLDDDNAAGMGKIRLTYRLGVLCHFYADFFCAAHNGACHSLRQHIRYERELCHHTRQQMERLKLVDLRPAALPQSTSALLQTLEADRQFHLGQPPQQSAELYAALQACFLLVDMGLQHAARRVEPCLPQVAFPPVDLEAFFPRQEQAEWLAAARGTELA